MDPTVEPVRATLSLVRGAATTLPRLTGRRTELLTLRRLVEGVGQRGGAVLVTGEAGIGKTTLAESAAHHAYASGFTVLRCAGVEREHAVGFSGLHQLLHPLLDRLPLLPTRQRAALERVFGLDESDHERPVADQLLMGTATLGLLEEASKNHPLFLLVDDVQWLDRSSAEVVGFLARRLERAQIVLVATLRSGDATLPDWAGLRVEHLPLAPLTGAESGHLLDQLPEPVTGAARSRIVDEAYGNPLALHELSSVLQERALLDDTDLLPRLPLSQRLEDAFMAQVRRLSEATQRFLLVAAAGEDAPFSEVVAAARELGLSTTDLAPAEAVGLVRVLAHQLRFRHPLARSAVYSAAPISARLEVHRALAGTPDAGRSAWHRASATLDGDESVAVALDAIAEDARQRGAQAEASAAYERAATLSVEPAGRLRRLVEAAETARLAGLPSAMVLAGSAQPLLTDPSVEPALAVRAAVTRWRLSASHGEWISRIEDLVRLAEHLAGPGRPHHAVERTRALAAAAAGVFVVEPPGDLRQRVRDALVDLDDGDERNADLQVALLLVDPRGHAQRWRGRLGRLAGVVLAPNRLASAAEAIHDLPAALSLWTTATELTRQSREVSEECLTLHGQALVRVVTGDLTGALASAGLAQRIAGDAGLFIIEAAALIATAHARTWLGDLDQATTTLQRAQTLAGSAPVGRTAAELHWVAGLVALSEHRNWDAWVRLRQAGKHSVIAAWAVGDLTEAAVRTGKVAEVTDLVEQLERDNEVYASPHLTMLLRRSRALLGDGAAAETAYQQAIAAGRSSAAPLELARTRLMYGGWLRRQRRGAAGVEPLTEAMHAFDAAGARLWGERAAAELRAAGAAPTERHLDGTRDVATLLTAQELQIAHLAAEGLTNREIADQVYLSHRTVGSHLYRIFPKLGLTSRAQLRDALGR